MRDLTVILLDLSALFMVLQHLRHHICCYLLAVMCWTGDCFCSVRFHWYIILMIYFKVYYQGSRKTRQAFCTIFWIFLDKLVKAEVGSLFILGITWQKIYNNLLAYCDSSDLKAQYTSAPLLALCIQALKRKTMRGLFGQSWVMSESVSLLAVLHCAS